MERKNDEVSAGNDGADLERQRRELPSASHDSEGHDDGQIEMKSYHSRTITIAYEVKESIFHNARPCDQKVKKFRKDPVFDKPFVIGITIIVLFLAAMIVMVYLSDGCRKINGKWDCSADADDEEVSWRDAYCTDPKKYDCHYLSSKDEIHVHVIGQLIRCDGLLFPNQKVIKVDMWDGDTFLHFGDDELIECRILPGRFLFVCHHRARFLIEGVSEGNPPDLYFKITINDTDPNSNFCGEDLSVEDGICELNTKDVGTITPDKKAVECTSPNSEIIQITREPDITQQLDPTSALFLETSQLDNWTIWKCYVRIYMPYWERGTCAYFNLTEQIRNYDGTF
ncbi:uncharacterized protein LOC142354275 [Convolutriloba macropyga]|uniref:uncharacterized protein LOC142354275 n=1 Tax=Convolutriloba macropyga TaxID=536237 RepID=UPI003F522995